MNEKIRVLEFSLSTKPYSDIVQLSFRISQQDSDKILGNEMELIGPDKRMTVINQENHYSISDIKFLKYYSTYYHTEILLIFEGKCKITEMVYPDKK